MEDKPEYDVNPPVDKLKELQKYMGIIREISEMPLNSRIADAWIQIEETCYMADSFWNIGIYIALIGRGEVPLVNVYQMASREEAINEVYDVFVGLVNDPKAKGLYRQIRDYLDRC